MLESSFFRAEELDIFAWSAGSARPKGHVTCLWDVSLHDSQENMAETKRKPVRKGGRYCVAGSPNGESCKNTQYTPEIYTRICSLQSLVLGLNGLNVFVDIVLILVNQLANLHLRAQLILSRIDWRIGWRKRSQVDWRHNLTLVPSPGDNFWVNKPRF